LVGVIPRLGAGLYPVRMKVWSARKVLTIGNHSMLKRTRTNSLALLASCALMLAVCGCQSGRRTGGASGIFGKEPPVRHVICLYDRRPWLSADAQGDRDPEGFRFRIYLDVGKKRGVYRDGTFHIDMYGVTRAEDGKKNRELISDWHYPASTFTRIRAKVLGDGYMVSLRWASKDIAGRDVEVVTTFEDAAGRKIHASTRRLRVPKYDDYLGQAN